MATVLIAEIKNHQLCTWFFLKTEVINFAKINASTKCAYVIKGLL
jgi:hypothetical protein